MKRTNYISALKKFVLPVSLVVLAIAKPARSDTPPSVDPETVRNLIDKVDKQEAEIQELKTRLAESPAVAAPTTAPTAGAASTKSPDEAVNLRLDKQEEEIKQTKADIAAAAARETAASETYPTLSFHGFGDIDYHTSNQKEDKNATTLGEFDLFLTSQLAENYGVLTETVVAPDSNNQYGIEIERLLLQVQVNDYFNIDVGRYHTALGYYNTAFHHGTWFQTAVGRPEFLNFEDSGGILPVHNVGLSMHGAIPYTPTKLGLSYYAEIGNGRNYVGSTSSDSPVNNDFDNNNYKAFNLAFISRPEDLPGVEFGAGYYHDTLNPVGIRRTAEDIIHAHLVYKDERWEYLSEAYAMHHDTQDGPNSWSKAFYVQISRKYGKFTPYFRFTYLDANTADEVYQLIGQSGRHFGPSVGLRYELSDYVALKAQYDYEMNSAPYFDAGPTFDPIAKQNFSRFTLQVAFTL